MRLYRANLPMNVGHIFQGIFANQWTDLMWFWMFPGEDFSKWVKRERTANISDCLVFCITAVENGTAYFLSVEDQVDKSRLEERECEYEFFDNSTKPGTLPSTFIVLIGRPFGQFIRYYIKVDVKIWPYSKLFFTLTKQTLFSSYQIKEIGEWILFPMIWFTPVESKTIGPRLKLNSCAKWQFKRHESRQFNPK